MDIQQGAMVGRKKIQSPTTFRIAKQLIETQERKLHLIQLPDACDLVQVRARQKLESSAETTL